VRACAEDVSNRESAYDEPVTRVIDALRLLALPYYVLGPSIDNWIGVGTQKHLSLFFTRDVGGRSLRTLVESRLSHCEWSVRHEGFVWASVVECLATGEGLFRWEVST
jgi:hypothetical protein